MLSMLTYVVYLTQLHNILFIFSHVIVRGHPPDLITLDLHHYTDQDCSSFDQVRSYEHLRS